MEQIFIENYRIDISRCLVHRKTDTFSLEPKVTQVLLYLAKHQGEVVSYQSLLDAIWPNSIVDPSALQRCIGQLRKALQDDAKQQRVIKTYPKNGYSLIAEVQWESSQRKIEISKRALPALLIIIAIITVLLISWKLYDPTPSLQSQEAFSTIESIQPEEASSDFYAAYSPNARYIVYPRFVNNNLRHLWARDLANDTEYQLTQKPGIYEDMSWSPDSQQLIFIESNCLDQHCQNMQCSSLELITLPLQESIITQTLIGCQSSHLQSPQWLNQNNIAVIEKNTHPAAVINYNLGSNNLSSTTPGILFKQIEKIPQHLTYSSKTEKLAITTSHPKNRLQQEIFILSTSTGELSALKTNVLSSSLPNEAWLPIWDQRTGSLLIPSNSGVFSINLDGKVTKGGIFGSDD